METFSLNEKKIINHFAKQGYITFDIKNKKNLENIKKNIINLSKKILGKNLNKKTFFNNTHNFISQKNLNKYRLKIYNHLNKDEKF